KGAFTTRLDGFDNELVFAALFVDIDASADEYLNAVFRLKTKPPVAQLPADAFDLRLAVFEGEVAVAARDEPCAGDFARDPDIGQASLEGATDGVAQFAERVNPAFGQEAEGELFHKLLILKRRRKYHPH